MNEGTQSQYSLYNITLHASGLLLWFSLHFGNMNSRFGNKLYEWSHDTGDIHGADYGLSRDGLWSGASYAKSPVLLFSHDDMDFQLDRICSAQSVSKPSDPSVSLDSVKRDRAFTLGMPEKQRNLTKEELKREKR